MPPTPPTKLCIILEINALGDIPDHHQTRFPAKTASYFENGIIDMTLHEQLTHFGKDAAIKMVKDEISSWLADLGTSPAFISVTPIR